MRIITYNLNGIRSAASKGLLEWMQETDADLYCFQEIKIDEVAAAAANFFPNHHVAWHHAEKKGYSGVCIVSKQKPVSVEIGCGNADYDKEGRIVQANFANFSIMNVYMPSGTQGDIRQGVKEAFMDFFYDFVQQRRQQYPNLVIVGDFNICHKDIDINHPKKHTKMSGFLPHEREWMTKFIESGNVDTFREFNLQPEQYTWWSYRSGAKAKNLGWRIDYQFVTPPLVPHLKDHVIHPQITFSDHCPTELVVAIDF